MRLISICLLVFTVIGASFGANNKLYVKFSPRSIDPNHTQGYFELPRSLNNPPPKDGKWSVVEDRLAKDGFAIACKDDYRVCLIVDKKNNIAGLQLSVSAADLQKTNAPVKPQLEKKNILGTEVYSTAIMFVEDSVLKAGGRDLTESTETAPNGIYVKPKGVLQTIPKKEADMAGSRFVKQRCYPGMGRHYFHDYSKQADCATLDTYFGLYNEQSHGLVGVGYAAFGNSSTQENGRTWFEYTPKEAAGAIAPDAPECASDYITRHGSHSLHIYVTDEPWNLNC